MFESQDRRVHEKIITEIEQRMKYDESLMAEEHQYPSAGRVRQKRPFRLIPVKKEKSDLNEHSENSIIFKQRQKTTIFYGPPSNCSDLSQLGYTLNGYYLVNTADVLQSKQLETVYCAFKQPGGTLFNPSGKENRIGHLKLIIDNDSNKKSGGVHFEVTSNSQISGLEPQYIPFDRAALNIGGAFNLNTQKFTAPKFGVYRFLFKGKILFPSADQSKISVDVQLRVNNFIRPSWPNYYGVDGDVMFEKLLKLHNGDIVTVMVILKKNISDDMRIPPKSMNHNSYFIGSLLEELEL